LINDGFFVHNSTASINNIQPDIVKKEQAKRGIDTQAKIKKANLLLLDQYYVLLL
jgi:hypothetical protein